MKLVLGKLGIGLAAALLMWVSIVLVQLTCFFVIDIIFFILRLALEGSVGLMILLILWWVWLEYVELDPLRLRPIALFEESGVVDFIR
ncbi:hypothetical protein N656DRAFT_784814 [Canariomyces notabilis]|uniref:Uncharacterized protein n=1 Tax=Canariomyces notabilis TaxID=2074819 RepID=A0AAN6QDY9_9PEZI|nr:hypothetical protein N656DRAFT_784814 [Canariomyces arenarius]